MKAEIRCVVDTNVLISAILIPDSVPYRAVQRVFELGVLCQSPVMLHELKTRIYQRKFDKYIRNADRERFIRLVADGSVQIEPGDIRVTVSRDPDDNRILELALAARADAIVSGDEDLLVLNPFRGIPVLTPREFLDWVNP